MNNYDQVGQFLSISAPVWLPVAGFGLAVVLLWSIFWKGLALWHSAQRGQQWWFVVMLIINTAGILEIIYLFGVAKTGFKGLFTNHGHHHE
jgi:hypothetical protein